MQLAEGMTDDRARRARSKAEGTAALATQWAILPRAVGLLSDSVDPTTTDDSGGHSSGSGSSRSDESSSHSEPAGFGGRHPADDWHAEARAGHSPAATRVPSLRRTTIVVPCFNEELRLEPDAFVGFVDLHPTIDFLFVNDGSRDKTAAVLDATVARRPGRLRALHLAKNGGKAEAVRQGMLDAIASQPRPDAVGFWDADLATPLEAIPAFIEVLAARADIEMVFGSRVNLLGRRVRRQLVRHWFGRIFATLASQMLRLPIYDTQCGAKLFRINDTLQSLIDRPFCSRWIFDVELIARLIRSRRGRDLRQPEEVIVELPLLVWVDKKGSKLKSSDFLTVGRDLVRIWRREMRGVPAPVRSRDLDS